MMSDVGLLFGNGNRLPVSVSPEIHGSTFFGQAGLAESDCLRMQPPAKCFLACLLLAGTGVDAKMVTTAIDGIVTVLLSSYSVFFVV